VFWIRVWVRVRVCVRVLGFGFLGFGIWVLGLVFGF
jgi:hypothetical protein